jgi:hypothetical protein
VTPLCVRDEVGKVRGEVPRVVCERDGERRDHPDNHHQSDGEDQERCNGAAASSGTVLHPADDGIQGDGENGRHDDPRQDHAHLVEDHQGERRPEHHGDGDGNGAYRHGAAAKWAGLGHRCARLRSLHGLMPANGQRVSSPSNHRCRPVTPRGLRDGVAAPNPGSPTSPQTNGATWPTAPFVVGYRARGVRYPQRRRAKLGEEGADRFASMEHQDPIS